MKRKKSNNRKKNPDKLIKTIYDERCKSETNTNSEELKLSDDMEIEKRPTGNIYKDIENINKGK